MAWIALTRKHIAARMACDEIDAIEETGGDSDRLAGIIEQVTYLVRSKVVACHKNELDLAGLIPEECLHAAATIVKHDLRATLPSFAEDTELRREEYRSANQFLDKVASCQVRIDATIGGSSPSDPETGCFGGDPQYCF